MNDLLKEKIKTSIDKNILISPFYQEGNRDYYKNKLINIENVVYQEKSNIDDDFEGCKVSFCYILTFEDEKGNIHHYESKVKPKKIGKMFYYIVADNKIVNIFSEKDKKELKKYIVTHNYNLPYKNKIFTLNRLIMNNFYIVFPIFGILISILIYLTGYFSNLQNVAYPEQVKNVLPMVAGCMSIIFSLPIPFIIYDVEIKILDRKRKEQKEKIFKKFL